MRRLRDAAVTRLIATGRIASTNAAEAMTLPHRIAPRRGNSDRNRHQFQRERHADRQNPPAEIDATAAEPSHGGLGLQDIRSHRALLKRHGGDECEQHPRGDVRYRERNGHRAEGHEWDDVVGGIEDHSNRGTREDRVGGV